MGCSFAPLSENSCRSLTFCTVADFVSFADMLSAVQGQAQCCLTGAAFEHMLQQADLSVIETIMRNVVVFACMRSHQKGQVMDMLGRRGLHHLYHGQQRHIPVSLMMHQYIDKVHPRHKCITCSHSQVDIAGARQMSYPQSVSVALKPACQLWALMLL